MQQFGSLVVRRLLWNPRVCVAVAPLKSGANLFDSCFQGKAVVTFEMYSSAHDVYSSAILSFSFLSLGASKKFDALFSSRPLIRFISTSRRYSREGCDEVRP